MSPRRSTALLVAASALLASACGSAELGADEATSELPPVASVIEIPADSELARALDASAPTAEVMRADGLEMPAIAPLVAVMSADPVTPDEVRNLAVALGVDPDLAVVSVDGGSAWDGATDVDRLIVTDGFGLNWDLVRSESILLQSGAFPCPTVAFDEEGSGGCVGGFDPVVGPPPTTDEVDAAVQRLLDHLDLSADDVVVRADADGAMVTASVVYAPGGAESDARWNLTVGTGGVIVFGNGSLRAPTPVMAADLIDLDDVMVRLGRVIAGISGRLAPLPTTMPATTLSSTTMPNVPLTTAVPLDGEVVGTVRPPGEIPGPVEVPVIDSAQPALLTVWDITNRPWFVPGVRLSGTNGFSVVIAAASADTFRVVDRASSPADPQITAPPLTIPGPPATAPTPTVPPPTTTTTTTTPTAATTPAATTTTTSLQGSAPTPPAPSTTEFPSTGPTLPRPTLPGPDATLVDRDGTPVTLPVPPDPNNVNPASIPSFYAETINAVLVGRPLADAVRILVQTGWEVRTDDLDDPTETFTADLRIGRANVSHRDGIVESVSIG